MNNAASNESGTGRAHDPRSVANLLLDLAAAGGIRIGHIKLQKLLYFAHGIHLNETGEPLVSGHFEAWKWGPVHPAVYQAFKEAGAKAIAFRAVKQDILTGEVSTLSPPSSIAANRAVRRVLDALGGMTDAELVNLSHAPGGPWADVVDRMAEGFALGARIEHNAIRNLFARHKLVVKAIPSGASQGADGGADEVRPDVERPLHSPERTRKSAW
jgi:uncharacterized phage-associated protein